MNRQSFIFLAFMFTILLFFITPVESHAAGENIYEVGTSDLNVRSAPSYEANIVGHLQKGEQVTAFKEMHGWVQTYYGGEVAWVASQFLSSSQTVEQQSTQETKDVRITASDVNIRSGPSENETIIGSTTSGNTYHLIEQSGDWVKVALTNGSGWIAADLTDHGVTNNQTKDETEKEVVSQVSNGTLNGRTIVLDPGHGGKDSGAIGFNGVYEKDLIDPMTAKVAQHLQDAGADVIFTRMGDSYISLDERIRLSQAQNTDAFVSIHFNSFPVPVVKGASTYYYAGGEDKNLAKSIQNSLVKLDSVYDRGIQRGDYKVLRENKDLAILIELGFITNPEELAIMQTSEFQNDAAQAITSGLINYFNK